MRVCIVYVHLSPHSTDDMISQECIIILAAYLRKCAVQRLHLLVRTYSDTQVVVDPLFVPISDIYVIFFQPFKDFFRGHLAMTRKNEIAVGLRKREAKYGQLLLCPLTGFDNLLATLLKILRISHRLHTKLQCRIVHGVGIDRVFHVVKILDQLCISHSITDSHSRHRSGIGKGLYH